MRTRPITACLAAALAVLLALPAPGYARRHASHPKPKQPTEQELQDEAFAKGLVGKTYDGDLPIDGWSDVTGGLVVQPIFVHEYQREDGAFLVVTSKELAKGKGKKADQYQVTDALIVPKPAKGVSFTIACAQGTDETLRFMGEAKGPENKEWWTDVRRAWEISLDTGQISVAKPKGVRCTNVSWGQ